MTKLNYMCKGTCKMRGSRSGYHICTYVEEDGSSPEAHLARTREWPNPNPNPKRVMLNYAGEYCEYGEYCDAGDA